MAEKLSLLSEDTIWSIVESCPDITTVGQSGLGSNSWAATSWIFFWDKIYVICYITLGGENDYALLYLTTKFGFKNFGVGPIAWLPPFIAGLVIMPEDYSSFVKTTELLICCPITVTRLVSSLGLAWSQKCIFKSWKCTFIIAALQRARYAQPFEQILIDWMVIYACEHNAMQI